MQYITVYVEKTVLIFIVAKVSFFKLGVNSLFWILKPVRYEMAKSSNLLF